MTFSNDCDREGDEEAEEVGDEELEVGVLAEYPLGCGKESGDEGDEDESGDGLEDEEETVGGVSSAYCSYGKEVGGYFPTEIDECCDEEYDEGCYGYGAHKAWCSDLSEQM